MSLDGHDLARPGKDDRDPQAVDRVGIGRRQPVDGHRTRDGRPPIDTRLQARELLLERSRVAWHHRGDGHGVRATSRDQVRTAARAAGEAPLQLLDQLPGRIRVESRDG